MRGVVIVSIAFLCYTLATTLFYLSGIDTFRPDLLAVFVFFVARTTKAADGFIICIVLALLFAPFHYTSTVLFVLEAAALYFAVRFSSRFLNLAHPLFMAIFLFLGELVLQGVLWGLSDLFFGVGPFSGRFFKINPVAVAGTTALVGPWIAVLLARLDRRFSPEERGGYLFR